MKNILITGASSGIGEELAVQYAAQYAEEGLRLFVTGRDEQRLERVAEKCRNKGAQTAAKIIDVCDRSAMAEWISGVSAEVGGFDMVIANAGISGGFGGQDIADIVQDYNIFDINLTGVLNTIYPALPDMVSRRAGQIVLISSMASFIPMPSAPAYSASKVAVRFYGEALAMKLKRHQVHVSIVCPGFIKSRMTDKNEFPMPFFMQTDVAVRHIIRAIAKKSIRIDFPWQVRLGLKIFRCLPSSCVRAIFAWLPDKKTLAKKLISIHSAIVY